VGQLAAVSERFKPKSKAARVANVLNEMNGNRKPGT
jgi:hypothetical protein